MIPELSATEKRIVLLLAGGWSKHEVAADLGLDQQTVDWHVAQATRKLERGSALSQRVRLAASGSPNEETKRAAGEERGMDRADR